MVATLCAPLLAHAENEEPAIVAAARAGDVAQLERLIASGAKVEAKGKGGDTALIAAAAGGHPEAVRMLLAAKASINAYDDDGDTAFISASDTDSLKLLLSAGASIDERDSEGMNALHCAVYSCNKARVEFLLKAGAKTEERIRNLVIMYMGDVYNGFQLMTKQNAAKADPAEFPTHLDAIGWTPLILASYMWCGDRVVPALLSAGADVDAQDANGMTSLMFAAAQSNQDTVEALLAAGADPGLKNLDGKTAVDVASGASRGILLGAKRAAERAPRQMVSAAPAPVSAAPVHAPVSDVDTPSYAAAARPDDFALVVGIENYSHLPAASHAERDAEAVHRHLLALGLPERNIIMLQGQRAVYSQFAAYLEEWLPKNVRPDSTVFFYYSGHGAPDPKTGQAFLLPWDGDPVFLQSSAYPVKKLYSGLAALKARRTVVVLDACFSGAGGRSVLAPGTKPLVTKVEEMTPAGDVTLFTASAGDEITGSLDEQGHGMFTYYFLKALSDGKRRARDIFDYLKPRVQDEAHRQNREQTPILLGDGGPL